MSFIKSLILAIAATFLLTYFLGASFLEMLGIEVANDISFKHELTESFKAISLSALAAIVIFAVAVTLFLGVFGTVILVAMLVIGAVLMFMLGAFWPICLLALVIWLMTRDSKRHECTC